MDLFNVFGSTKGNTFHHEHLAVRLALRQIQFVLTADRPRDFENLRRVLSPDGDRRAGTLDLR